MSTVKYTVAFRKFVLIALMSGVVICNGKSSIAKPPSVAQSVPQLSIRAVTSTVFEGDATEGVFVISRGGSTTQPANIRLAISGSAINGIDYQTIPSQIQIAAGAASVEVRIKPIDDSLVESDEVVLVGLADVPINSVITNTLASISIKDNDTVVEVAVSDPNGSESGPHPIVFRISRVGDLRSQLTVNYAINQTATNRFGSTLGDGSVRTITPSIQDGTSNTIAFGETLGAVATSGVDFGALPGTVTFQIGESSKTINVTPIDDSIVENTESVSLSLVRSNVYTIGPNRAATGFIADNDQAAPLPTVSISATQPNASEEGPTNGTVVISRSVATLQALTVSYSVNIPGAGNIPNPATNGVDFEQLSGQAVIPAGATSTTITVRPIDDNEHEPEERVLIQLVASPQSYIIQAASNQVTVKIKDHHKP